MNFRLVLVLHAVLVTTSIAAAQSSAQAAPAAKTPQPVASMSRAPQPTTPIYVDPAALNSANIIPPPPAHASAEESAELAEVHAAMDKATKSDTAAARSDGNAETIFLFADVLGPGFNAKSLPLTAELSAHLINDARLINLSLKVRFARPRPFRTDPTLHPTCGLLIEPSYPSGHAMNGYLLAFALSEIAPEKARQILTRAGVYARNRIVCGEHYPSDLTAGRDVALVIFGNILANPRYQHDLAAARSETRKALRLIP